MNFRINGNNRQDLRKPKKIFIILNELQGRCQGYLEKTQESMVLVTIYR